MLSRTSEYALRALVYLAQHADDWPIPGGKIAEEAGIPPKYLSSVLGTLARTGVLESSRGVGGGFRMVRAPDQVYLHEVLAPFEQLLSADRDCPFQNQECSDENPCIGHEQWKKVRGALTRFVSETTVHDIAFQRPLRRRPGSRKRTK